MSNDFQRVDVEHKRQALVDKLDSVCQNNGEDFVFHQVPKTQFLNLNDRLQQMEVMENSSGDIRMMEVFYNGPADNGSFQGVEITGILRQEMLQMGAISAFKVLIFYGINKNQNGEITNRNNFEHLITGYSPKGIFPEMRETNNLKPTVNGENMLLLLSGIHEGLVPAPPRPISNGEYAHYAEFRVFITDM